MVQRTLRVLAHQTFKLGLRPHVVMGFLYTGDVERRPCAARGGEAVATRMMVWLA